MRSRAACPVSRGPKPGTCRARQPQWQTARGFLRPWARAAISRGGLTLGRLSRRNEKLILTQNLSTAPPPASARTRNRPQAPLQATAARPAGRPRGATAWPPGTHHGRWQFGGSCRKSGSIREASLQRPHAVWLYYHQGVCDTEATAVGRAGALRGEQVQPPGRSAAPRPWAPTGQDPQATRATGSPEAAGAGAARVWVPRGGLRRCGRSGRERGAPAAPATHPPSGRCTDLGSPRAGHRLPGTQGPAQMPGQAHSSRRQLSGCSPPPFF